MHQQPLPTPSAGKVANGALPPHENRNRARCIAERGGSDFARSEKRFALSESPICLRESPALVVSSPAERQKDENDRIEREPGAAFVHDRDDL